MKPILIDNPRFSKNIKFRKAFTPLPKDAICFDGDLSNKPIVSLVVMASDGHILSQKEWDEVRNSCAVEKLKLIEV